MIWKALRSPAGLRLRRWQVQNHLLLAIEHLLDCGWDHPLRNLLREGVGASCWRMRWPRWTRRRRIRACRSDKRPAGTRARTAATRPARTTRWRRWPNWPESQHAALKFQAAYRQSVFSWLRERRLEVARQHLAQGWSVQQAAHFVGYRHATNFATAFRERYGVAPANWNQRADAMAASSPSPPSVFPRFAVRFRRQPLLRRLRIPRPG